MYHGNPHIKYTVCNKGQSCTAHEGLTKHSFPGFFLAPAEANPQWRGPTISYLFPLHQSYFQYLESKSSVWPKDGPICGVGLLKQQYGSSGHAVSLYTIIFGTQSIRFKNDIYSKLATWNIVGASVQDIYKFGFFRDLGTTSLPCWLAQGHKLNYQQSSQLKGLTDNNRNINRNQIYSTASSSTTCQLGPCLVLQRYLALEKNLECLKY